MKKIGAVALVLVLVAMTMGCSGLFGGGAKALYGTWVGEYTTDYYEESVDVTVVFNKDETYNFTVESASNNWTKEGGYQYFEESKQVFLRNSYGATEAYGEVDGKEINFHYDGYTFTLTKQ